MRFYILSQQDSHPRFQNGLALQQKLLELGHHVQIVPVNKGGYAATHKDAWALIASASVTDTHIILEDDVSFSGDFILPSALDSVPYDAIILWRHPSQHNTPVTPVQGAPGLFHSYFQFGICAYAITPAFAKVLQAIEAIEPFDSYLYTNVFSDPAYRVYITEKSPFLILGYLCGDAFFKRSTIWS